jgi:hypothetical protein
MHGAAQGWHLHGLFDRRHFGRGLREGLLILNPMNEATPSVVGEDVVHVAFADALLVLLPELRLQQVAWCCMKMLRTRGSPSRKGPNVSGNTSYLPTEYQISPDISSSSLRGVGTLRKLQSVTYSISS